MAFKENLYFLRRREKITQEQLADELGVSRQSVSKWETGEAYPETEKLIMLCDKFNVSMDELLRGDVTKTDTAEVEIAETETAEKESAEEIQENEENKKGRKIIGIIDSVSSIVFVAAYLLCGFLGGLWHPMWILCLCIPLIGCITEIFFGNGEFKKRLRNGLTGAVTFVCVIVYLFCGFYQNLWHPLWVIFLLIPLTGGILTAFLGEEKDDDD